MSVRSKRQSRIRYAGDLQGELFMKDKEESEKRQTGKNLQMMSIGTPMKEGGVKEDLVGKSSDHNSAL